VVLRLAKRLERAWRALPDVADAPCAPDLKSVDAIAEDGDPTTAVRIENLVFTNAAFRKMHLEVAWGLGGLEVMHVVVYPWASVAAPIYAADLVAFNGRVTLCIADVCPTTQADSIQESDADASTPKKNEGIPEILADAASALKHAMLTNAPAIEPRGIPDWGTPILSKEACVCVGPPVGDFPEQEQAQAFAEYAFGLFQAYASYVTRFVYRRQTSPKKKQLIKRRSRVSPRRASSARSSWRTTRRARRLSGRWARSARRGT
jgi:hypothetical protein